MGFPEDKDLSPENIKWFVNNLDKVVLALDEVAKDLYKERIRYK